MRSPPSCGTLGHISNFFASEPQIELAERLLALLGAAGRARSSSPTPAPRPTRPPSRLTRRTGRTHVVAMEGAFHGRTMGALALTSKAAYREPFEPLPGHVTFVPYGDVDALAAAVTDETAAVIIEPIQGEAGVDRRTRRLPCRRARDHHRAGALLWLDEVQTGMGRTGTWFAHQHPSIEPVGHAGPGDRGQGARRRYPDRCLPGHRGRRDPAPARQPRHHLRRQPGRLRSGPRRDRTIEADGPARARHRARPEAARRARRGPPGHRGPRRRSPDRHRARHGPVRRGPVGRARRRLHRQQPDARPRSGWRRRWC